MYKRIIIVATEQEYKLAKQRFIGYKIIHTGIGAINVIQALSQMDKNTPILNFGYVGSNVLPIGTEVKIGAVKLHHPNVSYDEAEFNLSGDTLCYSSCDFVLNTDVSTACVFDMELAFILAMGFTDVESIKIVSDNLSLEEYNNNI